MHPRTKIFIFLALCLPAAAFLIFTTCGKTAFRWTKAPDFSDAALADFTAYTPHPSETSGDPRIMASGREVYRGAAACPAYLKLGARIHVEGLGVYTCEDRLARRFRHKPRFDLLMFDRARAKQFGLQKRRYLVIQDAGASE